jgi:hypothetical protein
LRTNTQRLRTSILTNDSRRADGLSRGAPPRSRALARSGRGRERASRPRRFPRRRTCPKAEAKRARVSVLKCVPPPSSPQVGVPMFQPVARSLSRIAAGDGRARR